MDNTLLVVIILFVVILIAAFFISRRSAPKRQPRGDEADTRTGGGVFPPPMPRPEPPPQSSRPPAPSPAPSSITPAPPPPAPITPAPPVPAAPPADEEEPTRRIPKDLLEQLKDEEAAAADDEPLEEAPVPRMEETQPVRFSTYYPKEVVPDQWQPLVAYLFKEAAEAAVKADAKQQLGDKLRQFREVGEEASQNIPEGATVTATPTLEGFQFNPPSVSVGFFEDWHRFDFKLRAKTAPLNQAVNGMMTFTMDGIIVADIPISIFVTETIDAPEAESAMQTATAKPYDAIFCSYSRKDMEIVTRVERVYKLLGHEYMRDMISIRSGENWSDALERLIRRADIFQLFWSSTSSKSEHVAREWKYALTLQDKPANFIRPVFWEQPLPPVPDALSHIHFHYEPTLDD